MIEICILALSAGVVVLFAWLCDRCPVELDPIRWWLRMRL